jgi:hypothetical protein
VLHTVHRREKNPKNAPVKYALVRMKSLHPLHRIKESPVMHDASLGFAILASEQQFQSPVLG